MVQKNSKSHLKVDFMGDASWFLGQQYEWYTDKQGRVSCHILQQGIVIGMLEKHNLTHCNGAQSPYRSGLKIDRIEHDNVQPSQKEKLVRGDQSTVGSIN